MHGPVGGKWSPPPVVDNVEGKNLTFLFHLNNKMACKFYVGYIITLIVLQDKYKWDPCHEATTERNLDWKQHSNLETWCGTFEKGLEVLVDN